MLHYLCISKIVLLCIILPSLFGAFRSRHERHLKKQIGGTVGVHTIWDTSDEDDLPPYRIHLKKVFRSEAQGMVPSMLGMGRLLWKQNPFMEPRARFRKHTKTLHKRNPINTTARVTNEWRKHGRQDRKAKGAEATTVSSYKKATHALKDETEKDGKKTNRKFIGAMSKVVSSGKSDVTTNESPRNGSLLPKARNDSDHQRAIQLTVIGRKQTDRPNIPSGHAVLIESRTRAAKHATRQSHQLLYYKLSTMVPPTTAGAPMPTFITTQPTEIVTDDDPLKKLISGAGGTTAAVKSETHHTEVTEATTTAPETAVPRQIHRTSSTTTEEPVEAQPEIDFLNTSNIRIYIVPIQTTIRTIIQNDREFVMMDTMAKYPVGDELDAVEHWGDAARREMKWAHDRFNSDKQKPPVFD